MLETVFVSGSTGLVGAHLLLELANSDMNLKAMYRSEERKNEVRSVFEFYNNESLFDSIDWVKGDVLDVERLLDIMEDVDYVYHCAALVSFDPNDASLLNKINVEGTQNMLNTALKSKVKKFLHVSSTTTIGNEDDEICTELSKWNETESSSFYTKSKYASEREVWRSIEEGLEAVIINPSVIIGPGDPLMSSGTMFQSVIDGLKFYSSGANAFVDARDVAKCMVELMSSDISSERFLCIGENLNYKTTLELIAKEMNVKVPSIPVNKFMAEIAWRVFRLLSFFTRTKPRVTSESARASNRRVSYSNQKIKEAISFEFTPIESSVKNAVNYLKATQRLK